MGTKKLTLKQARFVREYLIDHNGKQAAIRANYAPRSAEMQASRLLSIEKVRQAVEAGTTRQLKALDVSADRVLREVARIAFSDLRGMFDEEGNLRPIRDLTDDQAAALASVEVVRAKAGDGAQEWVHKIKVWDKPKALELLMKKFGMLAEHEHGFGPLDITLRLGGDKVVNVNYAADGEVQETSALLEESKLTH